MSDYNQTELIQQIEAAFADVEYPGDHSLYRTNETKELIGKHWKNLPLELLRVQERILYLSPEALRFYLPAYLIAIATYPIEMDVLVDDIVYFLSPTPKSQTVPYLPNFDAKQKSAIHAFLDAYKTLFPDGSWKYYEPTRETLERAITYWQANE